jgi:hypothetical protein
MPLLHCSKCHHEYETHADVAERCDWCRGYGYILEKQTPLEKWIDWVRDNKFNRGMKNGT